MRVLALCLCMLLAACTEGSNESNQPRFVEQDRLDNPLVPLEHVDSAVHTEAMGHMRLIAQQVKLKASLSADKTAFYRSISGTLTPSTLGKLGLSEGTLKGTHYKASDYSLAIVGNSLTISAAQIGSRGRVEPQKFTVP